MSERKTTEQFIEEAKQIHGDRYNYSKVEYVNSKTKVCIICPIHGEFWQTPGNHLQNHGCPVCSKNKKIITKTFIEEAIKVHGGKYDYSKVDYANAHTKVCIICPEHGEFWQEPQHHLSGCGCPRCLVSKGEYKISRFLEKHNISYIHDKPCLDWLAPQRPDFYLPNHNMIIEFDGKQHFEAVKLWGGEKNLMVIQARDQRKNTLCEEHNIKIIRIPYNKSNNIDDILAPYILL